MIIKPGTDSNLTESYKNSTKSNVKSTGKSEIPNKSEEISVENGIISDKNTELMITKSDIM